MWPEFELMRIQREQAHRRAQERRLATALLRQRRAERRAERVEARASKRTPEERATPADLDAGACRVRRRWTRSAVTRSRAINIGKA